MIDYETFARIHDCRDPHGLTIIQIARTLGLNRKTVAKWLARVRYSPLQRHGDGLVRFLDDGRIEMDSNTVSVESTECVDEEECALCRA